MTTEAQKRAKAAYRKRKQEAGELKRIGIDFYANDKDLYEWLQLNKPISTYLKQLVREDMEGKECL